MAMCNSDSVDIMDCEDNKCANCPHKETVCFVFYNYFFAQVFTYLHLFQYNFSCNAIPMGKDYVQYPRLFFYIVFFYYFSQCNWFDILIYSCSNALPTGPHSLTQISILFIVYLFLFLTSFFLHTSHHTSYFILILLFILFYYYLLLFLISTSVSRSSRRMYGHVLSCVCRFQLDWSMQVSVTRMQRIRESE